ncbi:DUF397 domain-containing protein [Streptomyces qinzhouensis]|uniref:DUF397 domain-containing protein n=1 Tax=Streptomyces qinzhouensis TaxID=2599401 RepID=A0A5B8JCQ7_9ACTN|nr:DUF397 domain-containing protein [Streptomyces qinzhouensis]QDY79126.1 DUF397 domain-containing protein [Streptomyces qinzhouensis]
MTTNLPPRVTATDLVPETAWFKSSYSSQDNGNCIEVADLGLRIGVRDSKQKGGAALVVAPSAWSAFVSLAASEKIR